MQISSVNILSIGAAALFLCRESTVTEKTFHPCYERATDRQSVSQPANEGIV